MTTSLPHERYEELAAGHALAALEPEDEEVFLAHLPACARCERAVLEHAETMAQLAYLPSGHDVPAGLLEGIRAAVQAEGGALPAPVPLEAVRARRADWVAGHGRGAIAIAAAAALVFALGVWNVNLRHDSDRTQARSDRLAAALRSVGEAGGRVVALRDGQGSEVALALVHGSTVTLVVDGLAPNDRASSTYVLWQIGSFGGARAAGAFDVSGDGVDVVRKLSLPDARDVDALAVTREAGRVAPPLPSSEPVAKGSVT